MNRLLLDTNILLDCVDPSRAFHGDAMRLMAWCNGGGDMGIASSHSLNDAYYIMSRRYDEPSAREAVRVLAELVVIGPIGAEETLLAIDSNEPDFEDGLIRSCAELNDVDFIVSRDEKAFQKAKIRRVTAAEYLDTVCG
ncbi:MAG: PIN domain-containing protein [Eggerthellaceae bacterium]|nr:PIN domain-containing protein [Eggerthellaceae bacterium]MBQ6390182.1 PIN domain-containing protein [Eggerthellaceae bacterium]